MNSQSDPQIFHRAVHMTCSRRRDVRTGYRKAIEQQERCICFTQRTAELDVWPIKVDFKASSRLPSFFRRHSGDCVPARDRLPISAAAACTISTVLKELGASLFASSKRLRFIICLSAIAFLTRFLLLKLCWIFDNDA